ncbi:MAG TPA: discoidin domain-containing protein [Candidatus Eisenbacteria bacterium]
MKILRRVVRGPGPALGAAILVAAVLGAAAMGAAAPSRIPSGDSACPPGNLLATARLADSLDAAGATRSVVDDSVTAEGVGWRPAGGIRFETNAGSLTYDLGSDTRIAAAYTQATADNGFSLQISDDGREFREIWAIPGVTEYGRGMRSRFKLFWAVHARYVRFGEATGSGARAVSEIQVFCEIPSVWPPRPSVMPPAPMAPPAPAKHRFTRQGANALKIVLALLGAALLAWGRVLARRGTPGRAGRLRDVLLAVLGILGYTGYYNWGGYHFPERVHQYEFFHYYIGAKYFPELGYTGIYECSNVAEAEQGFRRRVELRVIRDLRRNELVSARYVLEDPERYKKGFTRPFTPERWDAFKKDTAYFRDRVGLDTWDKMLKDHGYNPSPVWNMSGSLLSNVGPASPALIDGILSWIDPVLLAIAFGFVIWAFGWRVACVAALFFGTNEPALYFWTGGAFLRQDWFALAIAGICLLKKGRPALGGAALAASTLLRLFPLGFFAAIGVRLAWILVRERRLDPTGLRVVIGAAIAVALLVPASSLVAGGFSAWPAFVRNIEKHESTPLTNDMGLRTLVAFRWETRQKVMFDPNRVDPFHGFREARRNALRGLFGRPLFYALVIGYLALLFFRVVRREMDWWVLAAFGFGVIPISLEMTCYYFSFLTAAALLWERRAAIPIGLLCLSAMTQIVEFQTYYYDMRYALESVVVIVFVVWATWVYGKRRGAAPGVGAASGVGAAPAPAPAVPG